MRLSPADFWRMSLPEWRAVLNGRIARRPPSLSRHELDALIRRYPDKS